LKTETELERSIADCQTTFGCHTPIHLQVRLSARVRAKTEAALRVASNGDVVKTRVIAVMNRCLDYGGIARRVDSGRARLL
jgi:hypothetical protein